MRAYFKRGGCQRCAHADLAAPHPELVAPIFIRCVKWPAWIHPRAGLTCADWHGTARIGRPNRHPPTGDGRT